MPLTAGTRLGSYEIVSPLGAGGMGEVYRARHLKLGREVAIKVLPGDVASDPERRLRFEREARAASALNHPNIVTIHDIDEKDGTHYIAMELVEGRTLRELLVEAPLPVGRLLELARQIAEGLARAHAAGIVHRDLKPENVMVTEDGRVKILDFGLAKLDAGSGEVVSDLSTLERATRTGVVMGTVPYMSPEQAAGRPVDFRSDQFSFGSILYEMASGRRPFQRATTPQTLAAIIEGEPEPLGRLNGLLPASLIAIVERCLAKDRAGRFESTRELAAALETVPETSPSSWIPKAAWVLGGLSAVILAAELLPRTDRLWPRLMPGKSAPVIQVLAVLPLQNLSGDPEQEYFAEGMTEALTTDLAKIGALKVISRSSATRYKGTKQPLADIASELGADALLEGSAVRDGGRVRITAQLVDPRTRQALWAESYERDFADVLRLQGEVAQAIAQRVRARLTPEEQGRLASGRAVNPEAYEAYLRGRFYNQKLTREDLDTALRYFELALQKDPQYAPGYAGIASVWGARQQFGWASPREAGPKRMAAVERAMALDSEMPEVRLQLARMKAFTQWDFPGAEAEFRRTLELNPSDVDARVLYSRVLDFMGRPAEAASHIERARQLDPHSAYVRAMYAVHLCRVGRHDEAVAEARSAHAADPALPLAALRIVYVAKGMLKEALEVQADTARRAGDSELAQILQRGHEQGSYRDAERMAAELLAARSRKGTPVPANEVAVFYDAAGLPDKALDWVEKGIEQRDPNVMGVDLLTSLSTLPGGSGNARLQEVRRRIGLP